MTGKLWYEKVIFSCHRDRSTLRLISMARNYHLICALVNLPEISRVGICDERLSGHEHEQGEDEAHGEAEDERPPATPSRSAAVGLLSDPWHRVESKEGS